MIASLECNEKGVRRVSAFVFYVRLWNASKKLYCGLWNAHKLNERRADSIRSKKFFPLLLFHFYWQPVSGS